MRTPWGESDHTQIIARGAGIVDTPSHGGIYVTRAFVDEHNISADALKEAVYMNDRYFFEEDCAYAVIMWELPHLWSVLFPRKTADEVKDMLLRSLSSWNLPYLKARGVKPNEELAARYLLRETEMRMRREKHPDLIVSASSLGDGRVAVTTADDKTHIIPANWYDCTRSLNLLSLCKEPDEAHA